MKVKILLILFITFFAGSLYADEAKLLEDPEIKDRFKHLASELRCLKCQNQTIWDSKAGLADDLRKQIRTQIYAGKSDDEIVEYMVDRYGEFVRYKPVVDQKTMFLWLGPLIFLVIGIFLLYRYIKIRREQNSEEDAPLTEEDRLRAQAILEKGGDK